MALQNLVVIMYMVFSQALKLTSMSPDVEMKQIRHLQKAPRIRYYSSCGSCATGRRYQMTRAVSRWATQ